MGQAILKNCPVCRKPASEKYSPFCSGRCADIDLGRWLGEAYKMPTEEGPIEAPNSPESPDSEE
jgi:endogenous inhibitor of DNA gyrase (YacG/DUF329 family)